MAAEILPTTTKVEPSNQPDTNMVEPITDEKPEEKTFSPTVSGNKGCSNCPRDYNI